MTLKNLKLKKFIVILVISSFIFIAGYLFGSIVLKGAKPYVSDSVSIVDGVQFINIKAGLGYLPNKILAKADTPTKLVLETKNTYDCSAFLSIPSLNIEKFLPPTGITEVNIEAQKEGAEIIGSCGSETYGFSVRFG